MHTRFISHADGPPNDLNVDDIWTTIVRETKQICQESENATSDPDALSIYHGSAGFAVSARLISSFDDLGPPLDRVGRANLQEYLQQIKQNTLPNIVELLLTAKWRPKSSAKTSFLETPVGIATEVLIDAIESPNSLYKEESISACTDIIHRALDIQAHEPDEEEDGGCEVLYGQAGLLYAILRLQDSIERSESKVGEDLKTFVNEAAITNLVHSIITRGRFGASVYASNVSRMAAKPGLMWSWHSKRYLGAAHGLAGILHVLLLCPVNATTDYIPEILQTIEWLLTVRDDEGNWPSSLRHKNGYSPSENLIQWCHGAPGFLILFTTLLRRAHAYPGLFQLPIPFLSSLASAIQQGASIVYARGLLRKGVGLCHGVAGSVYALLAASDAMGLWKRYEHSKAYFLSAIHLAHLATDHTQLTASGEMTTPDKPWSLYGGLAGMLSAWAEVYDRLGTTGRNLDQLEYSWCRLRSGMPGFDDMNFRE